MGSVIDLDDPQAVAAELRRRGLPVHHRDDIIGTDERLREIFTSARLGGWTPGQAPKPRFINRGRLVAADERERAQEGE